MSRLILATEHVIWTKEQWYCIPFSDQSLFNLFSCDGRKFVRRSPKERYSLQCTKSSIKLGEVWWCLAWFLFGTRPLVKLHGKINATVYKEILKKYVLWSAINQPAVFMQDNAPCHTAKSVRTFLSDEDFTVMEWPAQGPDMNPCENIWKLLNERAKGKNPRNVKELCTNLKGEMEIISVDKSKTLIHLYSKIWWYDVSIIIA